MHIEHIEFRVEQQSVYMNLITQAYQNLIQGSTNRISRSRIQIRLESIKEQWEKFTIANDAINLAVRQLDEKMRHEINQRSYFQNDLYSKTYEQYLENVEKMNDLLNNHCEIDQRPQSASSYSQPSTQTFNCQAPRLPRIDLPKFNGNLADWLSFRDLFSSLVLANPTISAVEKLQYLKTSLHGSAAQLLKNTSLVAENFQKSWEALISFYENKRLIVQSALQALFAIKKVTKESASEIEYLYTSITQIYRTLETLERPVHAWDDIFVFLVTQRLDSESIRNWENQLGPSKEPPSWEQMREFLLTRMLSLQAVENSQSQKSVAPFRQTLRSHVTGYDNNPQNQFSKNNSCTLCSNDHYISNCPDYKGKTPQHRREFVIDKKLCFNCLGPHQVSNCRSTKRCFQCGKKHHSTLHFSSDKVTGDKRFNETNSPASTRTNPSVNHANSGEHEYRQPVLLPTAQIKVRDTFGNVLRARALLDQGSEISLITEALTQRLQLPRQSVSVPITGIGGQKSGSTRGIVRVEITPHFDDSTIVIIRAHVLSKLTSSIPSTQSSTRYWPHLQNIQLADPDFMSQGKIDLLIGADLYAQLLKGPIVQGNEGTPAAQLTTLGWIISGPSADRNYDETHGIQALNCAVDHALQTLLEKFWSQEEVSPTNQSSLPTVDQQCEDHFRQTHSRDTEGRYTVNLPFKASVDDLGDSQPSAHRMLSHLHRKFESSPSFLSAYSKFLTEYEQMKHMIRVPDAVHEPDHAFYLPHHGVVRETSASTKLRVVFNGSCKVPKGKPLNELLHTGPKLQKDIFDVLIWIRQFKYLFNADIEKMYRQIKVYPSDWKFQRILWKQNEQIMKYELTTVTYGLACAPYLALRCVVQLIQDEGDKYPLAIDTMTHGRYVDDIFGGADTIEQAQEKARQVLDLCMAGGFPLRKWNSNDSQVLDVIPSLFHTINPAKSIQDDTIRALGLSWTPHLDSLQFQFAEASSVKVTKRVVLSKIAQLFDPLGLLSPIFIRLKIFMQELWAIKLGWDDPLPSNQLQTWTEISHLLDNLNSIAIPRWVGTYTEAYLELHGFCDASQLAIAAAIYIRTIDSHHNISVTLLCSKTKVAPIKRITIPRLELSSAVLLTKLVARCRQILNLSNVPCYLWTDSSIVNVWINNHPSRWKDFVHNRVCYIQETLPTAQWQHVPGVINPADCATRGMSAASLRSHTIWWHGPPWLSQDSSQWPSKTSSNPEPTSALELRPIAKATVAHVEIQANAWNLPTRYSSFTRLLRVTSLCQRFIKRLKNPTTSSASHGITACEINEAKKYWIKTTQRQHFSHEIQAIERGDNLANTNALIRLTPFLDEDGLLRVGGRLNNSFLDSNAKHPYILPKDHHLSWLIINHAHALTLHGSTHQTLAYIRSQYWIVGGRNPVRSFILKCVTCTRYRQLTAQQRMGQLPSSRVTPSRAFLHTGVDYAGPFTTKTWKGKNARSYKSWVSLFVCLATSAIHLELVTDYSTDAFIAAYKRFIGRRGICATLTSDCGSNFKGADKELRKLFSSSSKELQNFASLIANDGTTWKFNPPSAPHFGGKWESGVKSMKYHLRRVMGASLLTYEEMTTLLIQIEAILNSRPICPLTNDPDDLSVLTPAHFLIGESLTTIPEPSLEHLQTSRLSRWQLLSQMIQRFWRQWSHGYLQRHLSVYKWNKSSPNLSNGALVFIMDERYPPAKWALGRVIQLHPGKDNLVRVATVKTSTSTFKRPIVKLCPLNVD